MAKSKTYSAISPSPSLATLLLSPIKPSAPLSPYPIERYQVLESEDRRLWHPARRLAPLAATRKYAAQVKAVYPGPLSSLRFADPRLVALCVRRKTRREILFAFKKTRSGSGAKKRKTPWSHISC